MAISYQQVGAARDTGAQGLMQLGQTLQQQSQFQQQLEQAKLEFETNQQNKAAEMQQAQAQLIQEQNQFETELQATAEKADLEFAGKAFENLKAMNFETIRNDENLSRRALDAAKTLGYTQPDENGMEPSIDSIAANWALTKEEQIAAEERLVAKRELWVKEKDAETARLGAESLASKRESDKLIEDRETIVKEEQLEINRLKLNNEHLNNEAEKFPQILDSGKKDTATNIIKALDKVMETTFTKDGKEKLYSEKEMQQKLNKFMPQIKIYNGIMKDYGLAPIDVTTDQKSKKINGGEWGFSDDFFPVTLSFGADTVNGGNTNTGGSTTSYMRNGVPVSEEEYIAARSAYMKNPTDPAVKAAFTSIQKQTN